MASVLAVWLGMAGCAVTPRVTSQEPQEGTELPVLRESGGTFSSIDRPLRLVIHDPGSLAMLPLEAGPVDFDREMVLVAALGPVASGEYSIRIHRVFRRGSSLHAGVVVGHPPADAVRVRRRASPYHLVVVPKSELNVAGFGADVAASLTGRQGRGPR